MPPRAEAAAAPSVPERRDVAPGRIYLAGGALLLILVVSLGGLWLVFSWQSSGPAIGFDRPDPAADLATFNAHQEAELGTLGWIDRGKGIARIPVAEAMQIIAQRGRLPNWGPASPSEECSFLEGAVPRSPAAINCAMGWGQWLGRAS